MKIIFLLLALLLVSCATPTPQTERVLSHNKKVQSHIDIPFVKQERHHCGPASMAMVLEHLGKSTPLPELNQSMVTESMEGTFQTEMLSSARRQGLLAMEVSRMEDIMKLIDNKRPVIVFQNLGLEKIPKWHYSVMVGYDLAGPDVFLHSGKTKNLKMDMRLFERTWRLGDYWALLVLPPNEISPVHSELDHIKAASMLETMGLSREAETSYRTLLHQWDNSELALLGLGNIFYQRKDLRSALRYLTLASIHHPKSSFVWHNLAIVQGESGLKKKANQSATKAMELASNEQKTLFLKNLLPWLKDSRWTDTINGFSARK